MNGDGTVRRLLWDADNGSVAAPAFGKIASFGLSYLKIPPTVPTTSK